MVTFRGKPSRPSCRYRRGRIGSARGGRNRFRSPRGRTRRSGPLACRQPANRPSWRRAPTGRGASPPRSRDPGAPARSSGRRAKPRIRARWCAPLRGRRYRGRGASGDRGLARAGERSDRCFVAGRRRPLSVRSQDPSWTSRTTKVSGPPDTGTLHKPGAIAPLTSRPSVRRWTRAPARLPHA